MPWVEAGKAAFGTFMAKRIDGLIVSPPKQSDIGHLRDAFPSSLPLTLLDWEATNLVFTRPSPTIGALLGRDPTASFRSFIIKISYLTACDTPDHRVRAAIDRKLPQHLPGCWLTGMKRWVHDRIIAPEHRHPIATGMLRPRQQPMPLSRPTA